MSVLKTSLHIKDPTTDLNFPLWLRVRHVYGGMVIGPVSRFGEMDLATRRPKLPAMEKEFRPDVTYRGILGHPTRWRPILVDVRPGEIDFLQLFRPDTKDAEAQRNFERKTRNAATAYFRTCLRARKTMKLGLRLESSGRARVYLNGSVVFDTHRRTEANQQDTVDWLEAKVGEDTDGGPAGTEALEVDEKPDLGRPPVLALKEGWNILLMRLDRQGDKWRLKLRFTEPDTGREVYPQCYATPKE